MDQLKSGIGAINRRILYGMAVYGEEEKQAVLKSMENRWLASGPLVKEFEQKVSAIFGKKTGMATNSGSSANLLALRSLNLPAGSEVITPACTFATTVSEILLNNLVPVFVDSVVGRYTINEDLVEAAITDKTRAILVPQLVGGVSDMVKLRKIADEHKLVLIDDSCDTIGPKIDGKPLGSYSDISTTSFYGSHIITALGMGGMLMTDDQNIIKRATVLRDWGRVGNDTEEFDARFNFSIDGIPYDSKFLYDELGYNMKMNEAAAAFGLVQLNRLPEFSKIRNYNFTTLKSFFSKFEKWFHIPYLIPGAETNWLAFPLTIKEDAPFKRYDFLKHMESKGIQTRVLFSGNITRHPVYKRQLKHRVSGRLENADHIMAAGLLLGCHNGLTPSDVDYIIQSATGFLEKF
ncbi:NarL family transcriptional regulator [archaeon]|nr:MAG: NarL family transcriptional regulator [archaeon]